MNPGRRPLWGPLLDAAGGLPITLAATLCDLRPRFLEKCVVGRGYRAIARNGRVILASDVPVSALAGRTARVRFQIWHKSILSGDHPTPYGLLFCVRCPEREPAEGLYSTCLVKACAAPFDLALDVGGGLLVEFRRSE